MSEQARTKRYRRAALFFTVDRACGLTDTTKIMATPAEIIVGNTVKVMWGTLGVINAKILFLHGK